MSEEHNRIVITDPKLKQQLAKALRPKGPFKVKCLTCRQVGEGATINDAHRAVPHNENCSYLQGRNTLFDSIDLSVAKDF